MTESQDNPNPIGDKYALLAQTFLERRQGRVVDDRMIRAIGKLLSATPCELVGPVEAADILEVSPQRAGELAGRMLPKAGHVRSTPLWVKEEVEEYAATRWRKPGRIPRNSQTD